MGEIPIAPTRRPGKGWLRMGDDSLSPESLSRDPHIAAHAGCLTSGGVSDTSVSFSNPPPNSGRATLVNGAQVS